MTVPSPWGCWACSQIATLSTRASFLLCRPFGRETVITQVVRPISASCSVVASFCTAAWVRMLMTTAGRCRSKYRQRDHARQEPRRVPDTAPDLAGRVCHLAWCRRIDAGSPARSPKAVPANETTVVAVKAPPTGRSTPTKSATKASTAKVRTILRTSLGGSSCWCLVSFEPESLRLWCVFFRLRACLPLFLSLSL